MMRAYEDILEVINDRTVKKGNEINRLLRGSKDCLMQKANTCKDISNPVIKDITEITKMVQVPIWEFTIQNSE